MSKTTDPQLTQWDEERDRVNDLAERARKMKLVVPVLPKETTDNQEEEEEDEVPFADSPPEVPWYALLGNAFCPTGKGGGVDPTCGSGSDSRVKLEKSIVKHRNKVDEWKGKLSQAKTPKRRNQCLTVLRMWKDDLAADEQKLSRLGTDDKHKEPTMPHTFKAGKVKDFDDVWMVGDKDVYQSAVDAGSLWVDGKVADGPLLKIQQGIQAHYNITQNKLARSGINEIELHRGIDLSKDSPLGQDIMNGKIAVGQKVKMRGNTFQSYSSELSIAQEYAETPIPQWVDDEPVSPRISGNTIGITIRRVVKREQIVVTPDAGRLWGLQSEYVATNEGSMEVEITGIFKD